MASDPTDEIAKQARDYAWQWFALHAAQRMQTFNFFLVATAFLVAAYAGLIEKYPIPAGLVALLGAWLAYWFNRLDYRNRELVKAGEAALKVSEARLASLTNIPEIEIQKKVDRAGKGASTYRVVIRVVEWTFLLVFLVGAFYAAGHLVVSFIGLR